jgi:hypothetical protein
VLHTPHDTSDFLTRPRERPRARIVARLLAQGVVLVTALACVWWGVYALGAHALASEEGPSEEWRRPVYVAGCPVGGSKLSEDASEAGCSEEGLSPPSGTSRRPGAGLGERADGAETHGDEK